MCIRDRVNGSCVEEIGNNVVIEFNGLDFAGGTDKITEMCIRDRYVLYK